MQALFAASTQKCGTIFFQRLGIPITWLLKLAANRRSPRPTARIWNRHNIWTAFFGLSTQKAALSRAADPLNRKIARRACPQTVSQPLCRQHFLCLHPLTAQGQGGLRPAFYASCNDVEFRYNCELQTFVISNFKLGGTQDSRATCLMNSNEISDK